MALVILLIDGCSIYSRACDIWPSRLACKFVLYVNDIYVCGVFFSFVISCTVCHSTCLPQVGEEASMFLKLGGFELFQGESAETVHGCSGGNQTTGECMSVE